MMSNLTTVKDIKMCSRQYVLAVNDTLNVISGKWKLPILAALLYGHTRFKDLQNNIEKITPRMLSKELKELEINGVVQRTVHDTTPVRIEYSLTASGQRIVTVLDTLVEWGLEHRKFIMKEESH